MFIYVPSLDPAIDAELTSDIFDNGSGVVAHPADDADVDAVVVDDSALNIHEAHFFDDSVKYVADLNDQLLVNDDCINIIDDNPAELRDEPADDAAPSEYEPADDVDAVITYEHFADPAKGRC